MRRFLPVFFCVLLSSPMPEVLFGQADEFRAVRAQVDFARTLRLWDGFGVNYVETAQTPDYREDPQEYGGLSLLSQPERLEVLELIFGSEGLKPGLLKMFLDPFHQARAGGPFDHESTTRWLRYFAGEGVRLTRERGGDLQILTTLYGPPPYVTRQGFMRGRDLDPAHKYDLVEYMVDWVKFLREGEQLPVKYLSLHNEGESWLRWPADGESGNIGSGHDYNLFWPPEQVVEFVKLSRAALDREGLQDVGVTPGETTNWYRFSAWGYADALAQDAGAMESLDLVTSHGFYAGSYGRWFGEHRSVGADLLRTVKPELHVWVTSTSWSQMDADFVKEIHGNIYSAKVNGIIPWACIQRPPEWVGGDPNPGTAFHVYEDGSYEVMPGYYVFKQVSRAGQPGMAVVPTYAMDSEIALIGFTRNGTENPDAFVLVNLSEEARPVQVDVVGSESSRFTGYRTIDGGEMYREVGSFRLDEEGQLDYEAPARSVTTFFARLEEGGE